MNSKQYIKPYKLAFLTEYIHFMSINDIKQYNIVGCFKNLCCCIQIGSCTNEYRVSLIEKFELFLLKRAINRLHNLIDITEEEYYDISAIFNHKNRYSLFYILFV